MKNSAISEGPKDAASHGPAGGVSLGPLPTQIGFLLRLAQLAVFHDFIRSFSAVDIRPAQHSVLTLIQYNPGIRQAELSAVLGIKRANVVPLLDGLEKRKLVRRIRAESDRRSYTLHLTDKGLELMKILTRLREEHETRLRDLIGEEACGTLLELLPKLQKMSSDPVGDDLAEGE